MEKLGLQHQAGTPKKQRATEPMNTQELNEILDSLHLQDDAEIKSIFQNGNLLYVNQLESIFLSCKIKKYNKYDWKLE